VFEADTIRLPLILENVLTSNPLSGVIDAVTLPLAILKIVNESADSGISDNPLPEPEKNEPVATLILPPLTN
jgi:hypothetical protein